MFSLDILTSKGHPFYRAYYASVDKAEKIDDHKVKFTFNLPDGETVGRRTIVLQKLGAGWKIVHIHASNLTAPAATRPPTPSGR